MDSSSFGRVAARETEVVGAAVVLSGLAGCLVVWRPDLLSLAGVGSPEGMALLAAGLLLGVLCLRFPEVALCCLVAFVYLNLSDVLVRRHGLPSLLQLSFVPLVLAGWWSAAPGSRWPPRALVFPLSGYLVVVLCSTAFAADRPAADARLLEQLRGFAIFLAVVMLARSSDALRRGAWTLAGAGALLGGLAVAQVATGDFAGDFGGLARIKYAQIYGTTFEPRIAGPLGDPNFFAQVLVLVVPFALALAWTDKNAKRRALAFGATGVAAVATVFTYSRGGALALGAVALLSVLGRGISLRKALLGLVPVLALTWAALPDDFARRLTTLGQLVGSAEEVVRPDSSFGERRLFTAAAWRMFEDHPLLGVGAGNYGTHFLTYAEQVGSDAPLYVTPAEGYYPHSLYLEIAAETGLVGVLVFGWALAATLFSLCRARRWLLSAGDPASATLATGCAIALGGYLLSSLFLHGHFIRYWWLLAGFSAAFSNVAARVQPVHHRLASHSQLPAHDRAGSRSGPAPQVRPAIAVLVSRFPLITETFILREIIEMERQCQPVLLVPLVRERPVVVHREAEPWVTRALYTPFVSVAIVCANLRMLVGRPHRYLRALVRLAAGSLASPNVFVRSMALFPKAVQLAERLERDGIQHLHAHYATHPATVALIISTLTEMTFSFTVHAHDIFVRRALLRWKLKTAAFVRSISEFNRAFLAGRYPASLVDRIHVIHVGIRPDDYGPAAGCPRGARAARPGGTARILCVASLQRYKGIPVLLDACALLLRRGVQFSCTVVGNGPLRPALEAQIRRLGLGQTVTLAGARPQHEVAALMQASTLLAMPSIVAPDGQMEGIPVAVMEAMAARLPVVASSLSGIPEAVEHGSTGVLVKPGDATELALAIERVLSDPGASRRMGDSGRAAIERAFRLDACVATLLRQIDRYNPPPRDHDTSRLPALCARVASSVIGLRRLEEGRDSRIAHVVVANGARPQEIIVKLHRSRPGESRPPASRARAEFDALRALSRAPLNGSTVPRPLDLQASEACVVMESCRGTRLDAIVRTGRRTRDVAGTGRLVSAMHRAGAWLRHFQGAIARTGDPRAAIDRLVETATAHLDRCRGARLPASAARAVRSQLDGLKTRFAPASLRLTAVHRDFWPGNIFVGDEFVEVIDFEGIGDGLPYEDVAYFLVHLELFFPGPVLRRRFRPLGAAFLDGYLPEAHGFDWAAFELCRIASALQILGTAPRRPDTLRDAWKRRMLRRIVVGGAA